MHVLSVQVESSKSTVLKTKQEQCRAFPPESREHFLMHPFPRTTILGQYVGFYSMMMMMYSLYDSIIIEEA
jgi:hypothetical protein